MICCDICDAKIETTPIQFSFNSQNNTGPFGMVFIQNHIEGDEWKSGEFNNEKLEQFAMKGVMCQNCAKMIPDIFAEIRRRVCIETH